MKVFYFVAESKGSMSLLELCRIEKAKTNCVRIIKKLKFSEGVRYDFVDNY